MSLTLIRPSSADLIDKCLGQLAIAFQKRVDAPMLRVYREALADLEDWAIDAAALQLRRKGGTFFPTTAQWHQVAEDLIAERKRATVLAIGTRDGYECEGCRDTGWCEEDREGRIVCIPCPCRATNSTYRRHTLSSRKSHNEEVKRS